MPTVANRTVEMFHPGPTRIEVRRIDQAVPGAGPLLAVAVAGDICWHTTVYGTAGGLGMLDVIKIVSDAFPIITSSQVRRTFGTIWPELLLRSTT